MNDLETVAFVNYGHFTAIPVLEGGARGLSLHLDRLDRDARRLFGRGLDRDEVRAGLHAAVRGHELPVNARITVFARDPRLDDMAGLAEPSFIVKIRPMRAPREQPPRVRSSVYQRELPEVKHVGTFGLFRELRLAHQAGYDDVLLVDEDGWISEGSFWNIGFHDGERIIWPAAPALAGVEMRLLRDVLAHETRNVHLSDLRGFRAAFMTNAIAGPTLIASIDDVTFPPNPELAAQLDTAHKAIPLEPLV
ncbi:MAG: aminotransferase class IV [Kibdelosporangium sp.]